MASTVEKEEKTAVKGGSISEKEDSDHSEVKGGSISEKEDSDHSEVEEEEEEYSEDYEVKEYTYEEEEYSEEDEDEEEEVYPGVKEIYYDSSEPEDYLTDEYKNYAKAILDSNGYDVPERPNLKISNNLVHTYNFEVLQSLSRMAIDYYNDNNKTNYVFHSVEKGNKQMSRGILYYITFRATCAEGMQDFQARVLDGIPDEEVEECILKGKPYKPGPELEPATELEPAAKFTQNEVHS